MRVWLGTSGWQYKDWRGRLYPPELDQGAWLEHYAAQFRTVEVNNTFYRLPERDVFEAWRRRTPEDFLFVVKASRYLTHVKRLMEPGEPVHRLMERAAALGPKLGPVLVQLPPTLKAEPARLDETLACFGDGVRVAFEPRHLTWFTDETYEILRRHGAALCVADRKNRRTPLVFTADWTYVRFHEGTARPWPAYGRDALAGWVNTLADAPVEEAWVYFNNDPGGWAVENARMFGRFAAAAGLDVSRFPSSPVGVARSA